MVKLKIKGENSSEFLEFWLEEDCGNIRVKSRQSGTEANLTEFKIKPNKSWRKISCGHLNEAGE